MDREIKKEIHAKLKPILKEYQVDANVAVRNSNTICLDIRSGAIDFITNHNKLRELHGLVYRAETFMFVNPFYYKDDFTGTSLRFLNEVFAVMSGEDRFVDIRIGSSERPYLLKEKVDTVLEPVIVKKPKRKRRRS